MVSMRPWISFFIIIYYNVFSGFIITFIFWFTVNIRIYGVLPRISIGVHGAVEQMGFRILFKIKYASKSLASEGLFSLITVPALALMGIISQVENPIRTNITHKTMVFN